jgi:hypothetical protein
MTKPDANDAPEPRVVRSIHPARPLAERFLLLAYRHRLPDQQELLIQHMLAGGGFDRAYTARVSPDDAFADAFAGLDRLEQRLDELAKADGEGDGEGVW